MRDTAFLNTTKSSVGWRTGNDSLKENASSSKLDSEYGTERMPANKIIDSILNGELIEVKDKVGEDEQGRAIYERNTKETIAAQAKAEQINKAFQDWIWKDPERTRRLVDYYNNTFNNFRPRIFDGSHLELPNMSNEWHDKIHQHQKDAIWRTIQDRTALLGA